MNAKRLFYSILFLIFCFSTQTLTAKTIYLKKQPPTNKVIVVKTKCPYKNGIWVKGHWEWKKGNYEWKNGYWIKPRPNFIWIDGHWEKTPKGWIWLKGHWKRK